MNDLGQSISAIALAIIGVAIVATIVSKNANTPAVLQAAGTSLGGLISAATSPVTGNNTFTGATVGAGAPMIGNLLGSTPGAYGLVSPQGSGGYG
jgi:uncharacterized membrane protein YgaE (UPF0421/DUF939 family)